MPHLTKIGFPNKLRFAAIGPITAEELKTFGVKDVLTPASHIQDGNENKLRFDSESLLALPEMNNVEGKKILLVRGIGGRDVLADTLRARGAQVTFAECYQRINPQTDCDLLAQLYAENKLHGIVVTSSEAMRHLLDLAGGSDWLKQTLIYVNNARVAEADCLKNYQLHTANTVGDEAMLSKILKASTS